MADIVWKMTKEAKISWARILKIEKKLSLLLTINSGALDKLIFTLNCDIALDVELTNCYSLLEKQTLTEAICFAEALRSMQVPLLF